MATVAAIVLAAGKGGRIGGPKLFLKADGETFLGRIIRTIESAGIRDFTVVVSPDTATASQELAGPHRLAVNPHPENGMLSSLHAGLQASPKVDGYMIAHVDHPYVSAVTVQRLVAAFQDHPHMVVKPSCRGRAGHPIIVPGIFTARVGPDDSVRGLAGRLNQLGAESHFIEVDDEGILRNINVPEDLVQQ